MPTIQIMWYKGRTTQQKSELADVITKAVAEIGNTTAEDTQIIFHDEVKFFRKRTHKRFLQYFNQ